MCKKSKKKFSNFTEEQNKNTTLTKLDNDPRITKVGDFKKDKP